MCRSLKFVCSAVWECEKLHAANTSNQQSTIYNQTIFTGASSLTSGVVSAVSGVNNNLQTAAIHIFAQLLLPCLSIKLIWTNSSNPHIWCLQEKWNVCGVLGLRLRFKYSSLLKLKGFYMLFYSTLWAINYCNEMYMSIMIQRIISMSSRSITAMVTAWWMVRWRDLDASSLHHHCSTHMRLLKWVQG